MKQRFIWLVSLLLIGHVGMGVGGDADCSGTIGYGKGKMPNNALTITENFQEAEVHITFPQQDALILKDTKLLKIFLTVDEGSCTDGSFVISSMDDKKMCTVQWDIQNSKINFKGPTVSVPLEFDDVNLYQAAVELRKDDDLKNDPDHLKLAITNPHSALAPSDFVLQPVCWDEVTDGISFKLKFTKTIKKDCGIQWAMTKDYAVTKAIVDGNECALPSTTGEPPSVGPVPSGGTPPVPTSGPLPSEDTTPLPSGETPPVPPSGPLPSEDTTPLPSGETPQVPPSGPLPSGETSPVPSGETPPTTEGSAPANILPWLIPLIVIIVLIILAAIGVFIYFRCYRNKPETTDEDIEGGEKPSDETEATQTTNATQLNTVGPTGTEAEGTQKTSEKTQNTSDPSD